VSLSLLSFHFTVTIGPKPRKGESQEMGGFCPAEASEMGTIPVFIALL